MDTREYCAQVLGALRRVTGAEKAAIRQELEDHMEDHAYALMDCSYSEEEAQASAVEAMGDPVEMAHELDRQYSRFWLVVKRTAATITILLALIFLLGNLFPLWESISARFPRQALAGSLLTRHLQNLPSSLDNVDRRQPAHALLRIGSDVIQVYEIRLGTLDGQKAAEVCLSVYDHLPGGQVNWNLSDQLWLEAPSGGTDTRPGCSGSIYGFFQSYQVFIQPDDTEVTLRYTGFGEDYALTIPLPKEVSHEG